MKQIWVGPFSNTLVSLFFFIFHGCSLKLFLSFMILLTNSVTLCDFYGNVLGCCFIIFFWITQVKWHCWISLFKNCHWLVSWIPTYWLGRWLEWNDDMSIDRLFRCHIKDIFHEASAFTLPPLLSMKQANLSHHLHMGHKENRKEKEEIGIPYLSDCEPL